MKGNTGADIVGFCWSQYRSVKLTKSIKPKFRETFSNLAEIKFDCTKNPSVIGTTRLARQYLSAC